MYFLQIIAFENRKYYLCGQAINIYKVAKQISELKNIFKTIDFVKTK